MKYIKGKYLLHQVKKQFDKAMKRFQEGTSSHQKHRIIFPFVTDFNPHVPNINKLLVTIAIRYLQLTHIITDFPQGSIIPSLRRSKNIKELLAGPKGSNYTLSNNDTLPELLFQM